ncbi:MAG: XerD [Gemmatimonadetes bacterium]|nr:XerD [Gemmatimonadota bacterium]
MAKKHPGTFENRGTHQRLILYCGGRRYTYRLDTFDRKAAEKFAREKHRELMKQRDRSRRGVDHDTRFSELLALYRRDEVPGLAPGTRRAYGDSFTMLEEYFVAGELGDPTLDRIGTKEVKGYLSWRRTQRRAGKHQTPSTAPISNRTLQKDRAVLHRLFDFADRLELREGNPVARVEQPKADPRSPVLLSDEQYETLLAKCEHSPQLWLYTLALGETGGRCLSEVLHLRWTDVDLAEGFLEIRSGEEGHRTKSGKSRFVPMTPRLHQALRDHAARVRLVTYHGVHSPWVFHHERDRRGCKAGQRVKSMRSAFDTAAAAAGIPDAFHRHDLRHRRVTTWLAGGANPVHVKEALGHSDLRTTMGYTHLSKEHLRSLVAPLAAVASPTSEKQA